MKNFAVIIVFVNLSTNLMAKEIQVYEDNYLDQKRMEYKGFAYEQEEKLQGFEKNFVVMQKAYEEKIHQLEFELEKTKARLVEKSIHEERIQVAMTDRYETELNNLKKELAVKTRSMLEYQRQVEKMKPDEETKRLIQINTELASELRKSEGHLATLEFELKKSNPNRSQDTNKRMPASIQSK